MIDEYIVDFPEYVGVGSGALSFLDGHDLRQHLLARRVPRRASRPARMGVVKRGTPYGRWALDALPLRDRPVRPAARQERFRRDFGVPVELGLPRRDRVPHARWARSRRNTAEEITLTDKGRYLLLVMMRETLAAQQRRARPGARRAAARGAHPAARGRHLGAARSSSRRSPSAEQPSRLHWSASTLHRAARCVPKKESSWRATRRTILVMGVGNPLMRDEGVGPRVIEMLMSRLRRSPTTSRSSTRARWAS